MVVADFNGNGKMDLFLGSGAGVSATLYFKDSKNNYSRPDSSSFVAARLSEDTDALAFDANGDGHLDLYVASGGVYDFQLGDEVLSDRLYINDGKGNFSLKEGAIP
ncbi:FG-GAP repeat domain-containing protein, partial [Campylobacter fetus subsp. venerealis]